MMRVTRTTMHGAVMKLSMWGDDAPLRGARTRKQGGRTPSSPFLEKWLPRRELLAGDGAMGVASGAVRRWAVPSPASGRMYHSPLPTNRTPLSQEVEKAKRKLTMISCHVAVAKAKLKVAGWGKWEVLENYVATTVGKTESKSKTEQLEKAKTELKKAKADLEKARTELKTAAARSVSLEMFRESVADGSKLRRNGRFPPFDEYPNAYALLDKILGFLDSQVYQRDTYGIFKKVEFGSPRPFELCLLKEGTDTDGVLLAVRAPMTDALQPWKATPPSALASLEGEWTFLRHDCLASTTFTQEEIPRLTKMAEEIALSIMGSGPVSIRDCLDKKREDFARKYGVLDFPKSLLDSEIFRNFRPEPRKLVDMSFKVVRKGDGKDKHSETPEDIAKQLAEVHALFFSAASGSGKTAAMFALLKMLEAEHLKQGVTTFGLTCDMQTLAIQYEGRTISEKEAAERVASHVAKRLVDELGMPPTGRGYEVKGLRVVLLVDEAGPYPEFAHALGTASATRNPTGVRHSSVVSDEFQRQLQLQLEKKGWQPHANGIKEDSLRLLVVVAGTGVGLTKDGTSLPNGVLLGAFQETNPFEVMGEMVDSAFAGPRFSEDPRSIPPGTKLTVKTLRDVVVEAVKSEETLTMFAKSNLRCAALLGELLARHCYCLPRDEVKYYVARNVLLLVSMVSGTFLRSNGWARYPDQNNRRRLAKLVLSLFATVPDGYHLLTADDLQKLVRELGAVEDCATRITTGGSTCGTGTEIEGKNRDDDEMAGVPAWGTLCYPNESTDATTRTRYLPTNRQAAKQYRLRVDPALLLVCVSILGHQIVPTTKEPSPQLYEIFVFAMTEALAFAHGEAAARYFKAHGGREESVPPDVIWPWLPKKVTDAKRVYGAKCVVTMSATRHRVVSHEDQLENTGKYESHPESDPVRSSDTIKGLLGLCPPAPPTSLTPPEADCAMVVELAARNAAQSDVLVHTATGSIGMECKEFVNGDPISFDVLVKRARAMGYGTVVVELPESAFSFRGKKVATVTDPAVSSLLEGKKKDCFSYLVRDRANKRVRLTFSAGEIKSSAVLNRMLRTMLLRKAREELPFTCEQPNCAAAATVPGLAEEGAGNEEDPLAAEDVVVLVAPLKGLLPEGCRVWFENPWRLEHLLYVQDDGHLVAAPTEAGTPPTVASTTRWQFWLDGNWILKLPFVRTTTIDTKLKVKQEEVEGNVPLLVTLIKEYPQNRRVNVVCTQLSLLEYARRLVDQQIENTSSNKTKTLGKGNNEGGTQPLQL